MKMMQCWLSSTPQWLLAAASLVALRLWAGQEFVYAGYVKLASGLSAPLWFSQLDFPFFHAWLGPSLNWVIAGLIEVVLGVALILGFATRIAAAGLLYITFIAIYTVHFDLGWSGWNQIDADAGQGFKVPLMLGIMLLVLLGHGAGRWSLDRWLEKCRNFKKVDAQ